MKVTFIPIRTRLWRQGALYLLVLTLLGLMIITGSGVAQAQEPLPATIDFTSFTGDGFAPSPAAGQLDSDTWSVTGLSDGDVAFGGTGTSGDFARGSSSGGVGTGGIYAFDTGSGNIILGVQPGASDFTPGDLILKVQNNSGSALTGVDISYDVFVYNDQGRANSLNFSYSTDGTTFIPVAVLDFTTPEAADGSPSWQSTHRSATLSVTVANGDFLSLRWSGADVSGSGSRDEYGIDNISVAATAASDTTPPLISSFTPADESTDVAVNTNLLVQFNENVQLGSGNIVLKKSADDSVVETFDVSTPGQLSISGNTVTIDPTNDLDYATGYYVVIDNGAIEDLAGNPYQGFSSTDVWNFTTEAETTTGGWVINEIHADPDATNGDANGDGTINTTQDEFVEIVNNTGGAVDISGWTLSDPVGVRHTFPSETVVPDQCAVVIFSGGSPTGSFGGSTVQTASTGQLGLNNAGDTVTLNDGATDQATTTYGSEGGNNQSLTLDPDITGLSFVQHTSATGANGALFSPGTQINGIPFPGCSLPVTFIHDIQGTGLSVTNPNTEVTVEGVVVGDYQGSDELSGFFIQEQDSDVDGDANTSEGIFVFCGGCAVEVSEGQIVNVTGIQEEFFGMSQLNVPAATNGLITITNTGNNLGLVTPVSIDLPAPASTAAEGTFEQFEGMLVQFVDDLTVTEYFEMARYGQIVLSEGGKLRQFTHDNLPDAAGFAAHQDDIARRRIILDDLNNTQNSTDPVYHPRPDGFSSSSFIRGGYTVNNLSGVLHWSFAGQSGTDAWRIRPQITNPVNFNAANPRQATPDNVGGDLKIATFNVLNYFTTIDVTAGDDVGDCGLSGTLDCRGADSSVELVRQTQKLTTALLAIEADVYGLVELENNATASLQSIVDALNDVVGAGTYAYINTGTIGDDAIKVGFIYKTTTVSPSGSFALLDSNDFVDPNNTGTPRNRPALAQTFEVTDAGNNSFGEKFTAVVNHLKSKGSGCGAGDDDTTTGQGNCNVTRTKAAQKLVDWLATDLTGSGDADFLILGDLNSYAKEDPIRAIEAGADDTASTSDDYTNLISLFGGANAYSFVFDGQWGYLDHALATASMTAQVTDVTEWHINADEVNLLDYNDSIQDAGEASFEAKPSLNNLYAPDQYRTSDHDPLVVGLSLTPLTGSLTLIKNVINDDGGDASPDDFGLQIDDNVVDSGQVVTLQAGQTVAISETGLSGYRFVSITGDAQCPAVPGGTVTVGAGDDIECTITNDDIAPTITVNKVVIPVSDTGVFSLTINGLTYAVGGHGVSTGAIPVVVGTHTIVELGADGTDLADYDTEIDGDCAPDGTVTVGLAVDATCTITNTRVGIDLEKSTNGHDADSIPGPNIPEGDPVEWTYQVKNIGIATLTDVAVFDEELNQQICTIALLSPGQTKSCTAQGIARLGQYENKATVTATTPQNNQVSDEDVSHYFGIDPQQWAFECVEHRMEITGVGMGNQFSIFNPQVLSLAAPGNVNWLRAQAAGRAFLDKGSNVPNRVAFSTDAGQFKQLDTANSFTDDFGYTFETTLQPTAIISVKIDGVGNPNFLTPRAMVLYSNRQMDFNTWTSAGRTTNDFVWNKQVVSHTEVIALPPLPETGDLTVTAVYIDNNNDSRPIVIEAEAGGVFSSATHLAATGGDLLNIVNLTLPDVPQGTDKVTVTIRSPKADNGDSASLIGINARYVCDSDRDDDTIPNNTEGDIDPDGDLTPNYLDVESDGDLILDEVEWNSEANGDGQVDAVDRDADGDGVPNFLDLDSDNDGLTDKEEGLADVDENGILDFLEKPGGNEGTGPIYLPLVIK